MCKRFALLMLPFLSMCTPAASPTWQKAGIDNATLTNDTADCRASAGREAVRRYPHGFNYGPSAAGGMLVTQQRDDTNRATVEAASFNACMADKGYTRS